MIKKLIYLEKLQKIAKLLSKYWLLVFYISAIIYLELLYRLWSFRNLNADFIFPTLFAICTGTFLFVLSSPWQFKISRIISIAFTTILGLAYGMQLVYFSIFNTPLTLYSLGGAADAMQFRSLILNAVLKNSIGIIFVFVPLALLTALFRRLPFLRLPQSTIYLWLIFCYLSFGFSVIAVQLTGNKAVSQRSLYYDISEPKLSAAKLGLLTTMRLDLQRLVFGFRESDYVEAFNTDTGAESESSIDAAVSEPPVEELVQPESYNIMDIDFDGLIAKEKDKALLEMHRYFSDLKPTSENEYTGMFKGDNLILITAEGFSPYFISQELTPTLYEMSTQGFVFKNFYNPIWAVSTSDGEYVANTGLIPKSGVWSFYKSGKNYMPFAMGNQFKKLGYKTMAYHNHSYTYYKRNISHPNMGYDFKAVGNGLKLKNTWPESDLQMIEVTAPEYIGAEPFHTYYMTVSGHMEYNFQGNYIAKKNKALVAGLPYSEASRAYIASNLELEFALSALVEKLEAAGIADKTVIAISADHYPYGLPKKNIDELAGHEVEENFELYRSTFILWKKGIEPVIIEKPCSSLDIIPTLSNLFGLEYDSRLLMGSDIMSDSPALVIFSNRSWITDKASCNSITNEVTYQAAAKVQEGYAEEINKIVEDKFKFSARILEKNYYNIVVPK
ncbi:MAG: hypothetical protein K0R84_2269 [Clostridia bacterium]|jgi:phosphoglycerol transferase MdoB-like AlkP superfamily enzyme|nr:hypothetical protein [Clostridia bacterium]